MEEGLARRWSPEQIAHRLVLDHPDEPEMRVSHETIYRTLYLQARGTLKKELVKSLHSGRIQWRSRGRRNRPGEGRLRDMVPIASRPAEVDERAVPGHWEGDLVVGRLSQSDIATIIERQTRFLMLVALPDGRRAAQVRVAVGAAIARLPEDTEELRLSLTWDQGKEMAEHKAFTVDTGVDVYFCDPHSPWQRGTNENTNGLLRQYFPKGTDLRSVTQGALDVVAREMNGRPRRTLRWRTPAEQFAEAVAMTV